MHPIETRRLSKSFGSGRDFAVLELDLLVPSGTIFGFLGPNGSGKTTTIRMLLGLLRPTSGSIRLLERFDVESLEHARRHVGATVESPAFYPYMTAAQNLALYGCIREVEDSAVEPLLELVDLRSDRNRPVGDFSLGMKQRLALATALLGDPPLLILDEPTNGLDPHGLRKFGDALKRVAERGVTVFVSSHILHEVQRICSHVAVISAGKLRYAGSIEALDGGRAVVDLRSGDPDRLSQALATCGLVRSWKEKDGTFTAVLGSRDFEGLSRFLVERGVFPTLFVPRDVDLEQAFFDLTQVDPGPEASAS